MYIDTAFAEAFSMLSSKIPPGSDVVPSHRSSHGMGAVIKNLIAVSWTDAWARTMLCLIQ
jgi:hypothetical protein